MAPQARGSSTMGVKKSVVATRARLSLRRKIAASSRVAASTSTRGSTTVGRCRSTSPRSTDPSLQAQPAPCDSAVSRSRGFELGVGAGAGAVLLSVMAGSLGVERPEQVPGSRTPCRPELTPGFAGRTRPGPVVSRQDHSLPRTGTSLRKPGRPAESDRPGPPNGAETDQCPFLLRGRAEAAVGALPLLECWYGPPHDTPRGRETGRDQR